MAQQDLYDAIGLPPLSPEDMGVAPVPPAAAPMHVGPDPQIQKPFALALLAGALAGGKATSGLTAGVLSQHQQLTEQRQKERILQQQDAQRQAEIQAKQHQEYDVAVNRKQQEYGAIINGPNGFYQAVTKAKTPADYDAQVQQYASLLQTRGFRLSANQLRAMAPFVVPSDEKKASALVDGLLKDPLNKALIEKDPQKFLAGQILFQSNGDQAPRKYPISQLLALAGRAVVMDDQGQPIIPDAGDGKIGTPFQEILGAARTAFKAQYNRDPTPKEQQALITRATAASKESPSTGDTVTGPAEDIADAIMRGEQPPTTTGLYRYGAAVRASLARKGYDLAQAQTDWTATQKHIATLNGQQQERLRQAVDNASHSLDVIEDLAKQWQGGRFPVLNRGRLAAAKNGALGPQAQQIATQLEAQISDVTSELGNVYMGGGSPTDHALGLAAKNLSADWTQGQLLSAIQLGRKNLAIRANSMKSTGVAGASATNPYDTAPTAPAGAEEWIRGTDGKLIRKGGQ